MLKKFILAILPVFILLPVSAQQLILQKKIYFDFNRAYLKTSEKKKLDSIITVAGAQTDYTITLTAHTDSFGSRKFNEELSIKRRNEVNNYLIAKGMDPERIRAEEFGESLPEVENSTEDNRALNRRVEVSVYHTETEVANRDTNSKTTEKDSSLFVKANNGILIDYGSNEKGTLLVSTMTNTTQMEAENFTTMTTDNDILASNLVFRWQGKGASPDSNLNEPIKVRVPVGNRRYCKPAESSYYEMITDSATGEKKWRLIQQKPTIVSINGKQYFEFAINTLTRGAINCDRQISDYDLNYAKVKLTSQKLKITGIKLIYKAANVLYTAYQVSNNTWGMRLIDRVQKPILKVMAQDRSGRLYSATMPLLSLRHSDLRNSYILKRYFFRKV